MLITQSEILLKQTSKYKSSVPNEAGVYFTIKSVLNIFSLQKSESL